jgi:hypothetical protein
MSAIFDAYFYGIENGEVMGPLPLENIRAKVANKEVPEWIVLSRNQTGPWATLSHVRLHGDAAFTPQPAPAPSKPKPQSKVEKKPMEAPKPQPEPKAKPQHPSMLGVLRWIVTFHLVIGAIGVGTAVAMYKEPGFLPMLWAGVACFFGALWLMIVMEVLDRLGRIMRAVEK